ncbi:M20/M25/M40 family metallo-hydrolase [Prosthecodimorpha staleyi]|uniref:M20/M25/M40 family metallo-hydrolase n=1 Tax=Prosthecodimorpha staleyi TaxID=2840188 RepID=A0A947GEL7_9HYPH|nr:M20/M25/M40 family metallo-hydrolase [Prosthecodimorpha staleyi]MBT9292112.1 M20/M25/M40 family metallo-hydrolase [Prosthecodimorpha staleyi]
MSASFDLARLRTETLDLLAGWTAIESVAGHPAGLRRMANLLVAHLTTRLGATIVAEGLALDPPVVHARIDRGTGRRILLYNMYDVMPAPPEGWSVAPFAGGIVDRPGLGPCFVGRGAENNKGPLAGMLVALEALIAADALDADIEILIEGEEESGSRALRHYLDRPDTPVRPALAALFPSFCEYGGGRPRVYCGFKGIVHGMLRSSGGAWGGPSAAIHGSNAPWIANPAWRLVEALATLAEPPTGFLFRTPLAPAWRPMLDALAATFDPDAELAFRKTERFAIPGSPAERLEHVLTSAVLSLSRLATDPFDARGVIPCAAEARFELRLPPGAAPETVLSELRARLADAGRADVEMREDDGFPGIAFAPDAPGVAALVSTYRAHGADPQVWPWAIGAAPAYAFAAVAPAFLIGGLGHGGNAHGIDEFVTLEGIDRFLSSLLTWLPAIADESRTRADERSAP